MRFVFHKHRLNIHKKKLDLLRIARYIESLFLALILNLNSVKIVLLNKSNIITYLIFAIFIVSVLLDLLLRETRRIQVYEFLAFSLFIFVIWSISSIILTEINTALGTLLKFLIGIGIAYFASFLKEDERMRTLYNSLLISVLYSFYLLINYDSVYTNILRPRTYEYLMITLTLGAGLTLAIVFFILLPRNNFKFKLLCILSIFIQTVTLLRFPARGNVIFPFILLFIFLFFKNLKHPFRLLVSIVLIFVIANILYNLIVQQGNYYLSSRIIRLLTNYEEEPRTLLYSFYINHMAKHTNYIFGMGFDASTDVLSSAWFSEKYPHNLFLELIGENGIFGIQLIIVVAALIIVKEKESFHNLHTFNTSFNSNNKVTLFYAINACFLFYLFTYSKSYSIYNGYQLFIYISMIIHPIIETESLSRGLL